MPKTPAWDWVRYWLPTVDAVLIILLTIIFIVVIHGKKVTNGKDGQCVGNCTDGKRGTDGKDGKDGKDGEAVTNGTFDDTVTSPIPACGHATCVSSKMYYTESTGFLSYSGTLQVDLGGSSTFDATSMVYAGRLLATEALSLVPEVGGWASGMMAGTFTKPEYINALVFMKLTEDTEHYDVWLQNINTSKISADSTLSFHLTWARGILPS